MRDIDVPVIHERTRPKDQVTRDDIEAAKRYSLPVEINFDRLHDPNYRIEQHSPGRGRIDVVCVFVFSYRVLFLCLVCFSPACFISAIN